MSSVLKPSLSASAAAAIAQNPSVPAQLNKPMHPQQGPPQSYGQPSTNHHSIVVSHGNPTAAHNHPAAHQPPNHFSLNMPPNSYMGNNQPIPASNHPVPNNPGAQPSQQMYSGAKNMSYQGGYQANLGHSQNQTSNNQLPPVTQSLPATANPQTSSAPSAEEPSEKSSSQSNGTGGNPEEKPAGGFSQENHATTPKELPALPVQNKPPAEAQKPAEQQQGSDQQKNVIGKTEEGSSGEKKDATEGSVLQGGDGKTEEEVEDEEDEEEEDEEEDGEEEDGKVEEEKSGNDDKKEPSIGESESAANMPNESEKAVLETGETEVKEKSTPKRSSAPRKTSRSIKNDEESSKSTTKIDSKPSSSQKSPSTSKSKRARIRTQPYQSPLPEIEIISKISASQRNKTNDEKLIVFFKNEFLAVRNPEGSFYVCQAVQNIYKSSAKIRIRWLSLDKNDKTNQIYIPDFYDHTDFDCILTNLNLERIEKGKFRLPPAENERTDSILKRSIAAEKGEEIPSPTVNEEHPDGLDLSLYKDENQLNKRRSKKRKAASPLKSNSSRSPGRMSPDKAKLAKPTPKSTRKTPAESKKTPATQTPKKPGSSRTERAKRRSDTNTTKVTPVSPKVDQKKAKALAKVARKSVVQTSKVQTPVKKESKSTTPAAKSAKSAAAKVPTTSAKKKTPKRSATTKK